LGTPLSSNASIAVNDGECLFNVGLSRRREESRLHRDLKEVQLFLWSEVIRLRKDLNEQ